MTLEQKIGNLGANETLQKGRNMKRLLALIALMFSTAILAMPQNFEFYPEIMMNPRHKLTVALENVVKKTPIGLSYAKEMDKAGRVLVLGDVAGTFVARIENDEVFVNAEFVSAPFQYLAWVVMQSLVQSDLDVKINQKYGVDLSSLAEFDAIVHVEAAKFLAQTGLVYTEDDDYYFDSNFDVARKLDLSLTAFHQLFERNPGAFVLKVTTRKFLLDSNATDLSRFLNRPNLSANERAAALALRARFQSL